MSRHNHRGNGGDRQNAKQMSMNRFKAIDQDIGSKYDDIIDEEEEEMRTNTRMVRAHGSKGGPRGGGSYEFKKNQQMARGSAGAQREFVSRVKVPNGSKFGQRFILKALMSHVEDLKPIMPKMTDQGDFEFFIRESDVAQAVRSCGRRIRHPGTGERLNFNVSNTMAPWAKLKKEEKDAIEEVVAAKADTANRAVELSNFATHEVFTSKDLMMQMTKNNVFLCVIEVIEKRFSNIVALSLKNNRIKYLESASMLPYFAKHLTVLDLSDNLIETASELEKLRGLRLTTLFLENNPICENYSKASDYLSAIHAVFPRVAMIDGQSCEPASTVDDDDKDMTEPPSRPGFYGDDGLRTVVETFIIEFFKSYDGEDPAISRRNLIAAYDDMNSLFTMTVENLSDDNTRPRWPNDNFNFHIRTSHNVKQLEKWERHRSSRLFSGAMAVATQLCKMPATRHLTESFIVDVVLTMPTLLVFTVQGLFEEAPFAVAGHAPQLCFFSRTFTVTPKENGSVSVISDQLFLSALVPSRVERYKIQLNKANSAPPTTVPTNGVAVPDDATKKQMVESFMKESGMLADWSMKCLADSDWNYEVAGKLFLENRDKIPREAFIVP